MTMAASAPGEGPASKSLVVAGFIAATLFTTVVGGGVTYWVGIRSAEHQAYLADRTSQANRFIEAAEAFDPLVIKFVTEVKQGRITQPTRDAIKANLVRQRTTLESAQSLLTDQEEALANDYVEALVAADAGLKASTGPLDSQGFAQAAVNVATLRPKLYDALKGEGGKT